MTPTYGPQVVTLDVAVVFIASVGQHHYRGALAKGGSDNLGQPGALAGKISPTRQGATTHLRRSVAHPPRTHRLRRRPLLPRHRHQMGTGQTPRPTPTLHYRRLAITSPHPAE